MPEELLGASPENREGKLNHISFLNGKKGLHGCKLILTLSHIQGSKVQIKAIIIVCTRQCRARVISI